MTEIESEAQRIDDRMILIIENFKTSPFSRAETFDLISDMNEVIRRGALLDSRFFYNYFCSYYN
jgi:hypothetical protein